MKTTIALVGLLALAACATPDPEPTKPVVIQSEPIARPNLNLPNVDRYTARPVEWIIVTPENVDEVFAEMEARGEDPVLFGVNDEGYENIALNTQESLRVILQQQAVIDGYREYYVAADGSIREHNSNIPRQ